MDLCLASEEVRVRMVSSKLQAAILMTLYLGRIKMHRKPEGQRRDRQAGRSIIWRCDRVPLPGKISGHHGFREKSELDRRQSGVVHLTQLWTGVWPKLSRQPGVGGSIGVEWNPSQRQRSANGSSGLSNRET